MSAHPDSDPYYVWDVQWVNLHGTRKKLAVWVCSEMKLTELGRTLYKSQGTSYIIHVPVKRIIKRRNGTLWEAPESTVLVEWEGAQWRARRTSTSR